MHIPDGYLSPTTCAVGYAAVAPFWYIALKRVRGLLHTRTVPLMAVFSAFSFVIMMFNLPLPGGTTGHAVGIGIATVVLGPWAALLAVSIALFIQALFFGDGGITAFGFNCFNMGVVGGFIAWGTYRVFAAGSAVTATRRLVAATVAGYLAINGAALLTAIEFGLQPVWFTAADGTPLYAPYPLSIAVPAMMVGHLTFAGLAEAVVTGGIVRYLQRSSPALLALTRAPARLHAGFEPDTRKPVAGWRATRALWLGVAGLMILTPLGLLATATAWGEWAPAAFSNADTRAAITAASGHPAPARAPDGLERLASFWNAPIPDYAPHFMQSEALGYVLSAVTGGGLIILTLLAIGWLGDRLHPQRGSYPGH